MSGNQKEGIFVELRQYHLDEFPAEMSSDTFKTLREEFAVTEEELVNMVLSLISGKAEYVDQSERLDEFITRVDAAGDGSDNTKSDQEFFRTKVAHLKRILNQASKAGFPLRKQRPARISQSKKQVTEER